ncbi:MAG TPA: hypothetical protein VLV30_07645 [Methanomicrobiales archaeon]|nr:hypothetical protein [Methanomicrobiales archaeon]
MNGSSAPGAVLILLAVPLLISAVLGVGAVVQPDTIADGSPISISLSNVTDGYVLNITLVATFPPAPGVSWLNLTNWNYPFGMSGGGVSASGRDVNLLTLLTRAGATVRTSRDTGSGNITTGIPMDFLPVLYHDFRIGYEVHDPGALLTLTLVQQGTKTGPDDAVLTPTILGIPQGNLTVYVLTNGTLQASKTIRVAEAVATPAATPTAAPTAAATTGTTTVPPSTPETTAPTTAPALTTPVATPTPARTPSPAVTATLPPASPPSTEGPSPVVLGYIAVILIIALVGDYLLLRD